MSGGGGLDGAGRSRAEAVFVALEEVAALVDGMADGDADDRGAGLSRSALWGHVTGTRPIPADRLAAELLRDRALRVDAEAMLARACQASAPRVAAAATAGQVGGRSGDGFRLRLLPSRFDAGQIFVVITLERPGLSPSRLVAMANEGGPVQTVLPPPIEGVVQLLVAAGSDLARALADPESRIYLL